MIGSSWPACDSVEHCDLCIRKVVCMSLSSICSYWMNELFCKPMSLSCWVSCVISCCGIKLFEINDQPKVLEYKMVLDPVSPFVETDMWNIFMPVYSSVIIFRRLVNDYQWVFVSTWFIGCKFLVPLFHNLMANCFLAVACWLFGVWICSIAVFGIILHIIQ